jgi:alpha-tubulin suppressor-like RCC1 family protein
MNENISCGANHSVALKDDGTVECWGYNACDPVYKTFTNIIQITCGE